jgi:hypothetical protein
VTDVTVHAPPPRAVASAPTPTVDIVPLAVMGYVADAIIAYSAAPEPGYHLDRHTDPFFSGLEGAVALLLFGAWLFKLRAPPD